MDSLAVSTRRLGALVILAALTFAGAARAQTARGDEVRLEAVFGHQTVTNVAPRGVARFNEFRSVGEGSVFEYGRFVWKPGASGWTLSLSGFDAFQPDERYFLRLGRPGTLSLRASYVGSPRYYSSASTTLWSGIGTDTLTLNDAFRQAVEAAAGAPNQPTAPDALTTLMRDAVAASGMPLDLRTQRNTARGALDLRIAPTLSVAVTGRYETREGSRPQGIGTYIRRQALAGFPNTGAGNFWRETIEPRGHELAQPLDFRTTEVGAALTFARKGHTASIGWLGSWFRNDIEALYFDNPFEGVTGRASATTFDPTSDQEPAAPLGNNSLRGLYSRSAISLAPDNTYQRLHGNVSLKLPSRTRVNASASYGRLLQDAPFLPYAENDQVVYSGVAGQPGVVYAKDAPLPQASLDAARKILQGDLRITTRPTDALSLRAGFRYYDLDDGRPEIDFPGYSSSSDSYFRRGIGQKDADGNPVLHNEVGGYSRQRLNGGAAYCLGFVTLDAEYVRTTYDYEARQVTGTAEDALRGTVRAALGGAIVTARYVTANRDYEGEYEVGLEKSGVRAYDVWTRDRTQMGFEAEVPLTADLVATAGGSYSRDEYPGAVPDTAFDFAFGYGLQYSKNSSLYGGLTWTGARWLLGLWGGYDLYRWTSLQVTKTGLTADYAANNRWTRASFDEVFWAGLNGNVEVTRRLTARADVNLQRFTGTWETTNHDAPDVNSAVAYAFPELRESTVTGRLSLIWTLNPAVDVEGRYWVEPYRLTDFTWDNLQPYPQGTLQQTQSSASDVGAMNAGRLLWLDSRYTSYTAHVFSLLLRVKL